MSTAVPAGPPPDTRAQVIRTARDLMLTHSYLGLNLQELADQIGIRKASLYHHFPSKQALGEAVVEDSVRRFALWTESLAGEKAERQLLAFVSMMRDTLGAGARVCLIGATATEWDRVEPEVQAAVRTLHDAQLDWMGKLCERLAAPAGPLAPAAARQWAAYVIALCRGALLNARLSHDPSAFDAAVAPLVAQLSARH